MLHNEYNNTTPQYQSANKENLNCETSLLKLINGTLRAMDKKVMMLVSIDLSAAFDMADHKIWLSVLDKSLGIEGLAL